MRGEIIYRHHEEPGLKRYDPDNETFLIPLKYVNVMRQTQATMKNVSENVIIDIWTEAKGVKLSEGWTGTTRFQISCTRLSERYKWVYGSPTKIPKTARPDSIWP